MEDLSKQWWMVKSSFQIPNILSEHQDAHETVTSQASETIWWYFYLKWVKQ